MIRGFDPIARDDARVLVLGTIPSQRSLAEGRYYAHPQNSFWKIMEALFADGARLDYSDRAEMLRRSRVALWDVLQAAERPGSMDSSIVAGAAVPNDIAAFLREHKQVDSIFFNGATAEKLFRDRVAATLPLAPALTVVRLPSTSPAHASMSFDQKLAAWEVVSEAVMRNRQATS